MFLSVYPSGCQAFRGPHSVDCFRQVWYDAGCSSHGSESPDSMDDARKSVLDEMNIL